MRAVKSEDIIGRIEAMDVRGGSAIGRAAIQALALAVAEDGGLQAAELRARVERVGQQLMRIKPSMATVANAVYRATQVLSRQTNEGASVSTMKTVFAAWAEDAIRQSAESLNRIAEFGAHLLQDGTTLFAHSFSDSALRVLQAAAMQGKTVRVIATESRPLLEGRLFVESAASLGLPCVLVSDAAMTSSVREADVVLVGADAILASGAFVNKTGTFLLALAAAYFGVPLYVAAETLKIDPRSAQGMPPVLEERPASELTQGWPVPAGVTVWNRFFEVTPGRFVEAYVTERGLIAPGAIGTFLTSVPRDDSAVQELR